MKYALNANNFRWSLGAHDICFKNKFARAQSRLDLEAER